MNAAYIARQLTAVLRCGRAVSAMRVTAGALACLLMVSVLLPAAGAWAQPDQQARQASDEAPWIAERDELIDQELDAIDTRAIESFVQQMNQELAGYMEPFTVREIIDWMRGEAPGLSPREFLRGLGRFFFDEVVAQSGLLGRLIVLSVLAAVLHNLRTAFEEEMVGQIAYAVVFLVLAAIALGSFQLALALAENLLRDLVGFMVAILPLMAVLLAGVGAVATAGLFHPLIIITVNTIGLLVVEVVFPLIFFGAILFVVSDFVPEHSLSKLAQLTHHIGVAVLGLSLTVFMGIVSIQGAAASLADSITLRSAKFLTGTFIPVVGGWLADAAELVVGSSLIVKNGVGLFGMLTLFMVLIFPLLKLVALIFVYRLAAAIIQPVGGEQVSGLLQHIAGGMTVIAAASAVVAVLFLITVAILIGAGNFTVMMR